MPVTPGSAVRTHSNAVVNQKLGVRPARLYMVEGQLPEGSRTVNLLFNVVARDGAFTDTTQANYTLRGQSSSILRTLATQADARIGAGNRFKGELTTHFENVTPKTLNFEIIYRVDKDFTPQDMKENIQALQSLCYPRLVIAANPPLCCLEVLNLYSLEGYVTEVQINWMNTWELNDGLPMGAYIHVGFLMHQYPTMEEVRMGASFDSSLVGKGFSGTTDDVMNKLKQAQEDTSSFINKQLEGVTNFVKGLNLFSQQQQ